MPEFKNSYDLCVLELTAAGTPTMESKRACAIAHFKEFGTMPGTTQSKKSITKSASDILSQLSDTGCEQAEMVLECKLKEVGENSHFSELLKTFKTDGSDSPRLFREIEMVCEGTFNGIPMSVAAMKGFIGNWTRAIPFQADHSKRWLDGHGWIHSITIRDSKLYGLSEIIGQEAVTRVLDGRARNVSIGFNIPWEEDAETGQWRRADPSKWYLTELSWTNFPACPPAGVVKPKLTADIILNLQDPSQTGKDQTPMAIAIGTGGAAGVTPPNAQTGQSQVPDPAAELATLRAKLAAMEAQTPANQTPAAGNLGQANLDFEARLKLVESQAAENAALRKQVEELQSDKRTRVLEDIVLGFTKTGFSSGHCGKEELEFLKTLTDQQIEAYKTFKAKQGELFMLGRRGGADLTPPEDAVQYTKEQADSVKADLRMAYSSTQAPQVVKDPKHQNGVAAITPGQAG